MGAQCGRPPGGKDINQRPTRGQGSRAGKGDGGSHGGLRAGAPIRLPEGGAHRAHLEGPSGPKTRGTQSDLPPCGLCLNFHDLPPELWTAASSLPKGQGSRGPAFGLWLSQSPPHRTERPCRWLRPGPAPPWGRQPGPSLLPGPGRVHSQEHGLLEPFLCTLTAAWSALQIPLPDGCFMSLPTNPGMGVCSLLGQPGQRGALASLAG